MDYEQKYKEALEKAKKELDTCGSQDCDAARQIFRLFPELKESEDEKMIRIIMKTLQDINKKDDSMMGDILLEDCIAWLEKKSEQKSTWSEEDERILNKIQDHLREFYVDKKGYPYVAEPDSPEMIEANWLKSLKERMKGE